KDISIFAADWIRSGRLDKLKTNIFSKFPFLLLLSQLPSQIQTVLQEDSWEFKEFEAQVNEFVSLSARYPLFQRLLSQELNNCRERCRQRGDRLKAKFCEELLPRLNNAPVTAAGPVPVLVESYKAYNVVQYLDKILVVPIALGPLNLAMRTDRERPGIFETTNLTEARAAVDSTLMADPAQADTPRAASDSVAAVAQMQYQPPSLPLLSRFASWLEPVVVNQRFLFRLLVKHPLLFRTAQRFKHTLTGGGVA
ncbi:MAG: hypothetical protein DMG14_27540, partial [Acidobacteria bacterium]